MQNKSLNFMHFVENFWGWMLWSVVVYRIKRQHKGLHKGVKMEVPTILKVFCSKLLLYKEYKFNKFKGLIEFVGPLKGLPLNSFEIYGLGGLLPPKIRR